MGDHQGLCHGLFINGEELFHHENLIPLKTPGKDLRVEAIVGVAYHTTAGDHDRVHICDTFLDFVDALGEGDGEAPENRVTFHISYNFPIAIVEFGLHFAISFSNAAAFYSAASILSFSFSVFFVSFHFVPFM